jgi:3-oxoacyl-[acyl-carrier protein] reductase
MISLDLSNRRALVCGSTQGIGKATAKQLAQMGASVTLMARNKETLEQTQNELSGNHQQKHHYLVADFQDPENVRSSLESYLQKGNLVHILVNNSGGPPGGLLMDEDPDKFLQTFRQHLVCNHIITKLVLDGMIASGYGRVINIISTSVKTPIPNLGVSNTIRGAVANWSKTLANEVGKFGITVNNVLPGATATARLQNIIDSRSEKSGKPKPEIEQELMREIPLGRFAEPSEVAAAIAFLASPAASYISGINLPVDGGRTYCL